MPVLNHRLLGAGWFAEKETAEMFNLVKYMNLLLLKKVPIGFEPMNNGFADHPLRPLGYSTVLHNLTEMNSLGKYFSVCIGGKPYGVAVVFNRLTALCHTPIWQIVQVVKEHLCIAV